MIYLLNGMKYNWIVFIYLTDVNTNKLPHGQEFRVTLNYTILSWTAIKH